MCVCINVRDLLTRLTHTLRYTACSVSNIYYFVYFFFFAPLRCYTHNTALLNIITKKTLFVF